MPTSTAKWAFPYPVPADPADVPTDMGALAAKIEAVGPYNWATAAGALSVPLEITARPGANSVTIGAIGPGYGMLIAGDTNLYRSAAGRLKTDGLLDVVKDLSVDTGNAGNRIYIGTDVSLYRAAASVLRVTSHLKAALDLYAQEGAAQQVRVGNANGNATIDFGSAFDATLYRAAANTLVTNGDFYARYGIVDQVRLGGVPGYAAIIFGNANDVTFYRHTPGGLYLQASAGLTLSANLTMASDTARINFGSTADSSLYRQAANALRTGGVFQALSDVTAWAGSAAETRLLNSSGAATILLGTDTNLYRLGANQLATDAQLHLRSTVAVIKVGPEGGGLGSVAGDKGVFIGDSGRFLPTPGAGGGYLYSAGGNLHWISSGGKDTTIATNV